MSAAEVTGARQAVPERLRASRDIRAVFSGRAVAHGVVLVVHARDRADGAPPRVAVVAGRKVGSAVTRNRAKRRLRAAARERGLPAGADFVLVARAQAAVAAFAELGDELDHLAAQGLHRSRRGQQ